MFETENVGRFLVRKLNWEKEGGGGRGGSFYEQGRFSLSNATISKLYYKASWVL